MRLSFFVLFGIMVLSLSCSKSSSKENKPQENVGNTGEKALLKNAGPDEIQDVIASYEGVKAVLVNVWATWCIPCVEEFPEIVKIQHKYSQELQVVFISADFPENRHNAVEFLKKHKVDWTTYFKTGKDEPFINAVSKEWSGALPFTKVINRNGEVIAHWEKKADFDTFNTHVQQAINP